MKKALLAVTFICLSCTWAFAQNDLLETYVTELKADHAGPRTKTGFMTVGSDFLYAQEYFEAKNYEAAARSFLMLVEKDPANPFVNYQLAIALLRQNDPYKTTQAQVYLQQALKLAPALEKRVATDIAPATNNKDTKKDTKEVTVTTAQNKTTTGLAAYISRLKYSKATGGAETAMNTPGQMAMYAIEYFEANEYLSAENGFKLALISDPSNPYLKYLLAVSLAAQGKMKEAEGFYLEALKQEAELKIDYANDVAAATERWKKLEDSRKVKTAAPVKVVYGGELVYGNYMCSQTVYRGANATPAYGYVEKGYFSLNANGTYRWLDDGPVGRYQYNAKTGAVTFLSGYLKNNGIKTSRYQRNNKSGQITITYSENYTWNCGCNK